jgi:uncharacterized membrane protein YfcA
MAITFGFTSSIGESQLSSVYAFYFPENHTVFSANGIFIAIGMLIGAVLSIFFQIRIKLFVFIAFILISLVTYIFLDVRRNIHSQKTDKSTEQSQEHLQMQQQDIEILNADFRF